jgi:photosystem II stability/assembly factor-like uncharacterized protein
MSYRRLSLGFAVSLLVAAGSVSSRGASGAETATVPVAAYEAAYGALAWRSVGPARGGRSIAAAGSAQRPNEYFFGATGGGLWKTTDGGVTWSPVTDGQVDSASVGAVAIDPTDPDIVYIGMGEGQLRGNVLQGDGVYKSLDGGSTWRHMGLEDTRTITKLRIDPGNPSTVYAAALGDPYDASDARGVYRSTDGGETWSKILYRSPRAGAIDLSMDPTDPSVLYATLWEVYRKPWKLWSGGPDSSLYKSTDGGESWVELTDNPGLPKGVKGKMTVAVSPANPRRVYANIEAEAGGLYRSDDAGESWQYINGHRKLWQRSFYFMQLRPDPVDADTIYVLSFRLEKSTDGGQTFRAVETRHADAHDLWIDPDDPRRMILADDGGASVTVNGGKSWTEQDMPTAQIYRLSTTHDFPYKLCGTQQDNTAICVPSRRAQRFSRIRHVDSFDDFVTIAPSENGFVAPDPRDPEVFFVSSTNMLLRIDRREQTLANVLPYPYGVMGQTAASMRERWNWVFPVVFSPADGRTLYAGSQHLWRTRDQGQSWEKISPDLTRAEPATLGETGGPIRLDQDGPEVYGTLYSIAPSPLDDTLIWTGSDDGLVHVSRDGGKEWRNVTPSTLPAHSRVAHIHASTHEAGAAYLVAKRYEMGDRRPYVFRTRDYGGSWQRLDGPLPSDEFVHAIVEDPEVSGLLFLGTERGVAVSFDDGAHWSDLSLNLPTTPVMGMAVKANDLAIATHGRSFYVLEGLAMLRDLVRRGPPREATLYAPNTGILTAVPVNLNVYLPDAVRAASGQIIDKRGEVIAHLDLPGELQAGAHAFRWDLRHDGAVVFPGMILEAPAPVTGPRVLPGTYLARIQLGDATLEQSVTVRQDPRKLSIGEGDLLAQHDLALELRDAVSLANGTVIAIRRLRSSVLRNMDAAPQAARALLAGLERVESALYQVRNESPKDKIAFPIQLNDRLSLLYSSLVQGDGRPTQPQREVFAELQQELRATLADYEILLTQELARFNDTLSALGRETIAVTPIGNLIDRNRPGPVATLRAQSLRDRV